MVPARQPDGASYRAFVMLIANAASLLLTPMLAPRLAGVSMQVKQATQIEVGKPLPAAYVEVVTDGCAADDSCAITTAAELLGEGRSVLGTLRSRIK